MTSKNTEYLIVKYLTDEANFADLEYLSKWIKNPENEILFKSYIKTYYTLTAIMNNPDIESIKNNLSKKIKEDKNPFRRYKAQSIFKYAALIVVFFSIGYMYQNDDNFNDVKNSQESILTPKVEEVTLLLDNGTLQTISLNENKAIKDSQGNIIGLQKKSRLEYTEASTTESLVYNTINIPKGKRFDLVLSDGTHIFLNAGTTLRYPVKFIKNKNRDVFLTGEAYFDVAKDEDHPFIVHSNNLNIKVLGTKFNVSHYSENLNINTVLVEGSIELYNNENSNIENKTTLLKPGFKAEWNKQDKDIDIEKVDTRIYTAWIEGKIIFRNTSFLEIRNTLERHYNIVINNSNKHLDAQLFDATFDIETIDEILESFNKSYAIDYTIKNNEVYIN